MDVNAKMRKVVDRINEIEDGAFTNNDMLMADKLMRLRWELESLIGR